MPVKSEKQRRFMYASLAGKTDVPPNVAKKFVGPKAHAEGGIMKESKKMMEKEVSFMKKKGAPKSMIKHEMAEAKGYAKGGGIESKGKTKGKMVKMANGGMPREAAMAAQKRVAELRAKRMAPPSSGGGMPPGPGGIPGKFDQPAKPFIPPGAGGMPAIGPGGKPIYTPSGSGMSTKPAPDPQFPPIGGRQPLPPGVKPPVIKDPTRPPRPPVGGMPPGPGGIPGRFDQPAKPFIPPGGFAKGGKIDGCATKGKTKGRYI